MQLNELIIPIALFVHISLIICSISHLCVCVYVGWGEGGLKSITITVSEFHFASNPTKLILVFAYKFNLATPYRSRHHDTAVLGYYFLVKIKLGKCITE